MKTERLTVAQALVQFLGRQKVARDGREHSFFAGVFGIFGHGNVAGIGEALLHRPAVLPFYVPRNEQAMVHTAAAFAKASARLRTLACTTSIGPGATNMLTGAAAATINRLPVLLAAGRHLRHATSRSGAAAAGVAAARATSRSTTASSRCRATGTGSTDRSS